MTEIHSPALVRPGSQWRDAGIEASVFGAPHLMQQL